MRDGGLRIDLRRARLRLRLRLVNLTLFVLQSLGLWNLIPRYARPLGMESDVGIYLSQRNGHLLQA